MARMATGLLRFYRLIFSSMPKPSSSILPTPKKNPILFSRTFKSKTLTAKSHPSQPGNKYAFNPLKTPQYPCPVSPSTNRFFFSFAERTLVLPKDERLGPNPNGEAVDGSGTIAAIVTSLGGRPGAVGIVRLSGPSAVAISRRIFQPAISKKKKEKGLWCPRSHFVEYGVVTDLHGNVVDEVFVEIPTTRAHCVFLNLDFFWVFMYVTIILPDRSKKKHTHRHTIILPICSCEMSWWWGFPIILMGSSLCLLNFISLLTLLTSMSSLEYVFFKNLLGLCFIRF